MWEIAVLGGARTPFTVWAGGHKPDGTKGGALKELDVYDLGAVALRGALARSGERRHAIDFVAFGNVYPTGPDTVYGARYVGLRAGLPESVPAATPNMACGTGLYALAAAAGEIARGASRVAAGGSESISHIRKDFLLKSFIDTAAKGPIARWVADLAKARGISRDAQDRWALRSHERASTAERDGRAAAEIVHVRGLRKDDGPRAGCRIEEFAAVKPVFERGGVTRLNSHAIVDGACALILGSAQAARASKAGPLGWIRAVASAGVPPREMGLASVPAIRKLVAQAGVELKEIDLFEINETFAAQTLLDIAGLGLPEEKVNVNGGAVALGHPFAATGCRQVLTLLLELRRRRVRYGVASVCIGGGQGIAALVEAERT